MGITLLLLVLMKYLYLLVILILLLNGVAISIADRGVDEVAIYY